MRDESERNAVRQDSRSDPRSLNGDRRPDPGADSRATADSTAKTPSSAPSDPLPHVTLPKGGGAIRGMGEKFSVSAVTGTSSVVLPLPLSPGRSGFTPQLQLSYDSGSGN